VEPAPPAAPVEKPTVAFTAAGGPATATAPPGEPVSPPRFAPPTSESRPPFAPHGPWAQTASQPPYPPPPLPPRPPKPPKPPRERSKLGRITFFGIVVVMGVLVALDVAGMSVPISAYFAAALVTIALGLIVGAWFGRARGLIALAVLAALGLGVSSGVESYGGQVANNTYRPQTLAAVADRYDFTIGNATIDLRSLDFAAQDQTVTIEMRLGQVQVLLPPTVDTSVTADVQDGRVNLFGQDHDAKELGAQEITDLGTDGKGGGTLHLAIRMNAGNVEVKR
jgi:hypothetical protein